MVSSAAGRAHLADAPVPTCPGPGLGLGRKSSPRRHKELAPEGDSGWGALHSSRGTRNGLRRAGAQGPGPPCRLTFGTACPFCSQSDRRRAPKGVCGPDLCDVTAISAATRRAAPPARPRPLDARAPAPLRPAPRIRPPALRSRPGKPKDMILSQNLA